MDHKDLITSLLDHIQSWCDELADHEHGDTVIKRIEADMAEVSKRTEMLMDDLIEAVSECAVSPQYLVDKLTGSGECEETRRATMLEF